MYGICVGGDLPLIRGGSSAMGFLPGDRLAIWYYFPGEVLLWDFFRGKVCYMVFLQGERLPYGIISAGTISHGICSLIMKFVWGEIYHRGETLPYGIVSSLWKFCHWISSGEGLPYGIPSGGRLPYGIISGGGGGGFPCDTGMLLGGNACLGIEQIHDNAYFIHRYRRNK